MGAKEVVSCVCIHVFTRGIHVLACGLEGPVPVYVGARDSQETVPMLVSMAQVVLNHACQGIKEVLRLRCKSITEAILVDRRVFTALAQHLAGLYGSLEPQADHPQLLLLLGSWRWVGEKGNSVCKWGEYGVYVHLHSLESL